MLKMFKKRAAESVCACAVVADYTTRIYSEVDLRHTGRLQIQFNELWGRICSDTWDDNDALVACRSLGFDNGQVRVESNGIRTKSAGSSTWTDEDQGPGGSKQRAQDFTLDRIVMRQGLGPRPRNQEHREHRDQRPRPSVTLNHTDNHCQGPLNNF